MRKEFESTQRQIESTIAEPSAAAAQSPRRAGKLRSVRTRHRRSDQLTPHPRRRWSRQQPDLPASRWKPAGMSREDEGDRSDQGPVDGPPDRVALATHQGALAFAAMFVVCFFFAKDIYNILVWPFVWVAGAESSKFIYTALLEYFITQLKLAMFGAAFLSFPVVATQIYMFVAPGLYRHEQQAYHPYLIATPIFFGLGAAVYFLVMPMLVRFSLGMQQGPEAGSAEIALLPKVGEYLSLMMQLILAFGVAFQLPVILTLLGPCRHHRAEQLKDSGAISSSGRS